MNLPDLVAAALGQSPEGLPEREVADVLQDTRRPPRGPFVFVARGGGSHDGHRFIEDALTAGAVAVVGEWPEKRRRGHPWHGRVPYLQVADARAAAARLAATLHGHPSRTLFTLGVTGTDGKTTTATLLHHLLGGRYPTGLLSTAGIRIAGEAQDLIGHFTTPEAPEVQAFLAAFRDAGCSHAVIESSSHAFAQRRLDEVDYDIGVWTNLTPEHLDFHGSFEAYREAKLTLVRRARFAVLNADDPSFPHFAAASRELTSYGLSDGANWRASDILELPGELRWRLVTPAEGSGVEARLPMVGAYNVSNALAALAAARAAGLELPLLLERLATFPGVPGRMQVVQAAPFAVVVDFAHTAPALAKALSALRPQTAGRVIVVVGAAGERDPGKRAPLGEAATRYADLAVFTEEDHRSEDLEQILAEMARGAEGAGGRRGETFLLVPDRREAIRRAVAAARSGDLVLLAGKGHEATLERGSETLPWNEAAEAESALAARREPRNAPSPQGRGLG